MLKGLQFALGVEFTKGKERLVPTVPPETVRAVRVSLGLSPEQLAEQLSVTGRTVYAWESNQNTRSCTGPGRLLVQLFAKKLDSQESINDDFKHLWVDQDEPFIIGREGDPASTALANEFWEAKNKE